MSGPAHAVPGLLAMLLLAFLLLPCAAAPAHAREVVVGIYDMEPLSMRGGDGRLQGIAVDVMDAVARDEGWTVRYVYDDWDRLLPMLEDGRIDVLAPVAFSETRTAYRYNRDYLVIDWGQIWVRRGVRVDMLFDLEDKQVGGVSMSIFPAGFETFARRFGVHYRRRDYPDYSALLDALNRGEVDAAVIPRFIGTHHERRGNAEPASIVFSPYEMRYAAMRGRADDVMNALDRRMAEYKADKDSVYHRSLNRWIRTDEPVLPVWLSYALGAAAVLLLVLAGVNKALRGQVRRQTEALRTANEDLAASRDQIRNLLAYQQQAAEDIRRRISREVHDELGQNLTALKFGLHRLGRMVPEGDGQSRERLASMTRLTEDTIEAVRRISRELRPGHLDDIGLLAASQWLVQDFSASTGIPVHFDGPGTGDGEGAGPDARGPNGRGPNGRGLDGRDPLGPMDPDRAVAVYRVLQEALTNVARHAGARRIHVALWREGHCLRLMVADDGHGFDVQGQRPGGTGYLGIVNMRERVAAFGGEFRIDSGAGGTTVRVSVPLGPQDTQGGEACGS